MCGAAVQLRCCCSSGAARMCRGEAFMHNSVCSGKKKSRIAREFPAQTCTHCSNAAWVTTHVVHSMAAPCTHTHRRHTCRPKHHARPTASPIITNKRQAETLKKPRQVWQTPQHSHRRVGRARCAAGLTSQRRSVYPCGARGVLVAPGPGSGPPASGRTTGHAIARGVAPASRGRR